MHTQKTIKLDASPRKNWNTAQLLKSAQSGAESVGAETKYIDLYDLIFTGCHGCLTCKNKDTQRCHCFWEDNFSPTLDRDLTVVIFYTLRNPKYGNPTKIQ